MSAEDGDGEASFLDLALAEIARFTPRSGANLVGLDTFEPAGERLYLIASYATRSDANAALVARTALAIDEKVFVYPAPTRQKGRRQGPLKSR